MITVEKLNDHTVAHIEANGYKASVMYDPNTTPLQPFETVEALKAFAEGIEQEFNLRSPDQSEYITVAPEIIPNNKTEIRPDLFWRRFTPEEQILLVATAKEDPIVETFKMHLMMTPVVVTDDDVALRGMGYLVTQGLLTEERKNIILGGE